MNDQLNWMDTQNLKHATPPTPIAKEPPKMDLRMIVTDMQASQLIGRCGAIIEHTKAECGCEIVLSEEKTEMRVVTVVGTIAQMSQAFRIMAEIMYKAKWASLKTPLVSGGNVVIHLLANYTHCGMIIGKEGRKIKAIEQLTGASIQIIERGLPNSSDQKLAVSAKLEKIPLVIVEICTVIKECPNLGRYERYSPALESQQMKQRQLTTGGGIPFPPPPLKLNPQPALFPTPIASYGCLPSFLPESGAHMSSPFNVNLANVGMGLNPANVNLANGLPPMGLNPTNGHLTNSLQPMGWPMITLPAVTLPSDQNSTGYLVSQSTVVPQADNASVQPTNTRPTSMTNYTTSSGPMAPTLLPSSEYSAPPVAAAVSSIGVFAEDISSGNREGGGQHGFQSVPADNLASVRSSLETLPTLNGNGTGPLVHPSVSSGSAIINCPYSLRTSTNPNLVSMIGTPPTSGSMPRSTLQIPRTTQLYPSNYLLPGSSNGFPVPPPGPMTMAMDPMALYTGAPLFQGGSSIPMSNVGSYPNFSMIPTTLGTGAIGGMFCDRSVMATLAAMKRNEYMRLGPAGILRPHIPRVSAGQRPVVEQIKTETATFSNGKIGRIIGTNGEMIARIRMISGADVQVERKAAAYRKVIMTGKAHQIKYACHLICKCLNVATRDSFAEYPCGESPQSAGTDSASSSFSGSPVG